MNQHLPDKFTSRHTIAQRPIPVELGAEAEIVRLEQATKSYSMSSHVVHALDCIDLSVRRGELLSVMGPSGSGKSTALQMIGCLDQLTSGDYFLCGNAVNRLSDSSLSVLRNRYIGFVFQQFHLLPQLSALENVMLPMLFSGISKAQRTRRATEILGQLGLQDRLHNKPNQLSGGEQQRTAIARAVVNRPILLLADEPTGNLDAKSAEDAMEAIISLHKERQITVIIVTHDSRIASMTRRMVTFSSGKIVDDSPVPIGIG